MLSRPSQAAGPPVPSWIGPRGVIETKCGPVAAASGRPPPSIIPTATEPTGWGCQEGRGGGPGPSAQCLRLPCHPTPAPAALPPPSHPQPTLQTRTSPQYPGSTSLSPPPHGPAVSWCWGALWGLFLHRGCSPGVRAGPGATWEETGPPLPSAPPLSDTPALGTLTSSPRFSGPLSAGDRGLCGTLNAASVPLHLRRVLGSMCREQSSWKSPTGEGHAGLSQCTRAGAGRRVCPPGQRERPPYTGTWGRHSEGSCLRIGAEGAPN